MQIRGKFLPIAPLPPDRRLILRHPPAVLDPFQGDPIDRQLRNWGERDGDRSARPGARRARQLRTTAAERRPLTRGSDSRAG